MHIQLQQVITRMDLEEEIWAVSNTKDCTKRWLYGYTSITIFNGTTFCKRTDTRSQTIQSTYSCSIALNTIDCAVTKQLGSTCPSSPQIFAAKKDRVNFNVHLANWAERHGWWLVNEKLQFISTRISCFTGSWMIISWLKYLIETQMWIPSITTRNSFTNLSKASESSSGDIAQHYWNIRSTDTCNVIYYLFTTDLKIYKNKKKHECVWY